MIINLYMMIRSRDSTQTLVPWGGVQAMERCYKTNIRFFVKQSLVSYPSATLVERYLCRSHSTDVVTRSRGIPQQESRRMGSGGRRVGLVEDKQRGRLCLRMSREKTESEEFST